MNIIKWICLIILILLEFGCVQDKFTTMNEHIAARHAFLKFWQKSPNNEAILCTAKCEKHLSICVQHCHNSCIRCSQKAEEKARSDFYFYKREQYVKGGLIARDLQSYRDPLQCRKTTCLCFTDYDLCRQSCGGYIKKSLQPSPVC